MPSTTSQKIQIERTYLVERHQKIPTFFKKAERKERKKTKKQPKTKQLNAS